MHLLLFYTLDSHALVRVINYIQGIYPLQLQRIFEVKEKVDQTYPFQILSKKYKQVNFVIGFPILVLFYKDTNPQWQSQVISTLEKIFTGQQLPIDEVIRNINTKVRELSLKSLDLKLLSQTVTFGLVLLEFLINLNGIEKEKRLSHNPMPTTSTIPKENINFIFSVGLSYGYMLILWLSEDLKNLTMGLKVLT
jgi:hypothetical protein